MRESGSLVERSSAEVVPDVAAASSRRPSDGAIALVVVPREPGPLVPVGTGGGRPPDDLDLLVDEILGPPPVDRPGVADVVLVAAGLVALGWVVFLGAAPWIAGVAVFAIVLGLALPIRSLARRYRDATTTRRVRSAGRHGYLLDVADPSTAGLADAYAALLEGAETSGSVYAGRARDAAHAAMVEAATLLGGAPPEGDAQRAYVTKRTAAIAGLADLLAVAGRKSAERARESAAAQEARRRRWVDAVAAARDELQAEDRQGSLARIGRVSRRLRQETEEAVDADA